MSFREPAHRSASRLAGLAVTAVAVVMASVPANAETLEGALARAYRGNPALNASRATTRATDEGVAIAQSGYRPSVNLSADIGSQVTNGILAGTKFDRATTPGGAALVVQQNIFNGFQTDNQVRRAESLVYSQRESMRLTELQTLYNAVNAYMNVLSNTATLELNRNNVEVLEEQLRQTRDRFNVGEVTRTDVAQAEARLAGARSQVALAESALRTSIGVYRQNIGVEPRSLAPGRPLDRYLPTNLDAAEAQVKVFEGQLAPQVTAQGAVQQRYDSQFPGDNNVTASIVGRVSIPIYEGGQVYAQVRQQKELVGQYRIQVDQARDQVRASIVDFWGRLEAAKAQVIAAQAQVQANEVALNGVREEARVGQRTTLDVLNAQQELLSSRVSLIVAQRDRVIYSYGVVQAMGQLTARFTSLPVEPYSAKIHYDQVKDLWFGLRTPDGR